MTARWRWLVVAAATYSVCHHLGSLPEGLGQVGAGTRLVDWLDLAVPLLVLVPCGLALRAGGARTADWCWFGVGAVVYAQGHGIHLAANSVGNVAPGPTAHLWDEPVGHHVWFAGVALVAVSLGRVLSRHVSPSTPWVWLLAGAVGVNWGSNALGGGTVVMSGLLALVAGVLGWRLRRSAAVLFLPLGLTALVVVGAGRRLTR